MRPSLYAAIFAAVLLVGYGCSDRTQELQNQNATLQNANAKLNSDLAERDDYVNSITDSINDVYVSIENLKSKEAALLNETKGAELTSTMNPDSVRALMSERLAAIRTTLHDDHSRIRGLQSKLAQSKKEYAGMQKLVENLNKTLSDRDQSIADLGKRVDGLEQDVHGLTEDVSLKNMMLTQKDSVIGEQHSELTTAYYVAGTRDELEKWGIIKKEGGFPWGWFGSTTTLASGFDTKYFKTIDNTSQNTIQIDGKIDELVPKRSAEFYHQDVHDNGQCTLTISDPSMFWKQKYLIIVTDKPGTTAMVMGFMNTLH